MTVRSVVCFCGWVFRFVVVQVMGDKKIENSTQIWYDVSIDKNTYKKGVEFSLSSLTSNARFRQQVINNRRNME